MKRLPIIAAGAALALGVGGAVIASSFTGTAEEAKPEQAEAATAPVLMAQADTAAEEDKTEAETTDEGVSNEDTKEEDTAMSTEATAERTPEEEETFRQTMHEGDIALGVCGARVSALLWFYEASVAQGREDLKSAVASLTESRDSIKAEAERRAVDDKVDTSVRVMNAESEKIWDDLNEKAAGDAEEFQKAHDELFSGVQECLALFFDRPEDEKKAE